MNLRRPILALAALSLAVVSGSLAPVAAQKSPVTAAAISYEPAVTRHSIAFAGATLEYAASAGLMPIYTKDGKTVAGDMSYVAYSLRGAAAAKRPVAFIWNGGPGANTTLLHYDAFGPKRLAGDKLEPNPATLLDVADLVFIDQMETGFGRVAEGIDRRGAISAAADVREFAQFIETWMKKNAPERSAYLIGESYGVYRAVHVGHELVRRGVPMEGLVLISGSTLVLPVLDPVTKGVAFFPGLAALAFEKGKLGPEAGASVAEVHDNAFTWARKTRASAGGGDPAAVRQMLIDGFRRFSGIAPAALEGGGRIVDVGIEQAFLVIGLIGPDALGLPGGDLFDIRVRPGAFDTSGISSAIMDDIRRALKNNPDRAYLGQEPRESGGGVAIVNMAAHWPITLEADPASWPSKLMAAAPKLRLFFASGMFDARFNCAQTEEGVRRDLAAFADRVSRACYRGGHMMYEDRSVGAEFSADVHAFIRGGAAITP